MKILITDGLHQKGIVLLEEAGFELTEKSCSPGELSKLLPSFDGIIVRSATQLNKELLSACPDLKFIARGGVGMDNIDVDFAKSRGIEVFNTPAASSGSVAELVFGHIIILARQLHQSNREMPVLGEKDFKKLKKRFSKGMELKGKTLGIIGLGRIGTESARIALALGMKLSVFDPLVNEKKIGLDVLGQKLYVTLKSEPLDDLLAKSDVITLHVPGQDRPVISEAEIQKMKEGVIIINASRGGIIDEEALLKGLNSGKVAGAGLDVFIGEPEPDSRLLNHPQISLSPHIGAATYSAQEKIAMELAYRIIRIREEQQVS